MIPCDPAEVPAAHESGKPLGRHLDGCRIGFDLGATDRKVSAVIDGQVVFSEEVVWEPVSNSDPDYHYHEIMAAIRRQLPPGCRVVRRASEAARRASYIDNRPRVASLFRGIPAERFQEDPGTFFCAFVRSSMSPWR